MTALGLVVLEKKIFYIIPMMPPGQGHMDPRGMVGRIYKEELGLVGFFYVPLAAFTKENIIHWSTQHMKALGHMVSEKKIFYVFPMTPPETPGERLAEFIAGFIKRTTIHCYPQNMKALGLVVLEKNFPDDPGAGPV